MLGLLDKNNEAWISKADDPNRKLKFTLEIINSKKLLIGVNTHRANRIVEHALRNRLIQEFKSEKDIYKQELDKLDKKEDIKRNILEGKMKKFISENTLLNQPFVKDPSTSLSKIIKNNKVLSYNRYEVGEGLEKKSEDFAQEVYNQIS